MATWSDGYSSEIVGTFSNVWESGYRATFVLSFVSLTGASGIASAEAFGSGGEVILLSQPITGSAGIASAEAFGSGGEVVLFDKVLTGTAGIASAEAFGASGSLSGPIIGTVGIASAEAFGSGGNVYGHTLIGVAGITSEETFGVGGTLGSIGGPLEGITGIPSAEAFGVPSGARGTVTGPISGFAGIPTEEAFGVGLVTTKIIGTTGIPSAEFFPTTGRIYRGISGVYGIPSEEAFGGTGAVLQLDETNSNFAVFIGGNNANPYIAPDSIQVSMEINFQATARFGVNDETGSYMPEIGAEVIIYHYDEDLSPEKPGTGVWVRAFAGRILDFETYKYHVLDTTRFHAVNCTDYARSLSRRLLNVKYPEGMTLQGIMDDISSRILSVEGIQYVHQSDPGITFPVLNFSYMRLNEVLDKIAELIGGSWAVDFSKNLYVSETPVAVAAAPFNVLEATTGSHSFVWESLRVRRDSGMYRNRQYMKTNFQVTTRTVTETYVCPLYNTTPPYQGVAWYEDSNGDAWGFTDYRYKNKINRVLSMKLNGVDQIFWTQFTGTVAAPVLNSPTGAYNWTHVWLWDADFVWNIVGHSGTGDAPKDGDILEITYEINNELPEPVMVESASEIAARAAVEGGSGLYEAVDELMDVNDRDFVVEYATALLAKFGTMGLEVDFNTVRFGFLPGQQVTVNLPGYGISSQTMNVESVSLQEEAKRIFRGGIRVSSTLQQRDALASMNRLIKRLRKESKQVQGIVTWDLAVTYPGVSNPGLTTGTSLGNTFIVRRAISLDNVAIIFKTAPAGANIRITIKNNGASIFPSPGYVEYTSSGGIQKFTEFSLSALEEDDMLTIDVSQVGSTTPGKDGTVHLSGWV